MSKIAKVILIIVLLFVPFSAESDEKETKAEKELEAEIHAILRMWPKDQVKAIANLKVDPSFNLTPERELMFKALWVLSVQELETDTQIGIVSYFQDARFTPAMLGRSGTLELFFIPNIPDKIQWGHDLEESMMRERGKFYTIKSREIFSLFPQVRTCIFREFCYYDFEKMKEGEYVVPITIKVTRDEYEKIISREDFDPLWFFFEDPEIDPKSKMAIRRTKPEIKDKEFSLSKDGEIIERPYSKKK